MDGWMDRWGKKRGTAGSMALWSPYSISGGGIFAACCLQHPTGKPSSAPALNLADWYISNRQDLEHSHPRWHLCPCLGRGKNMVSPKKDSTRKRPSAENQGTELLGFKAKINKLLLPYSHFKSDSSKRKKKKNHRLFPCFLTVSSRCLACIEFRYRNKRFSLRRIP